MSLMIVSSDSELLRTVSVNSRCSGSRVVSSSRLVMPMMAFMGVRISWLMVARKALFASLAATAAACASWAASNSRALSRASEASSAKRPNSSSSARLKVRSDAAPEAMPMVPTTCSPEVSGTAITAWNRPLSNSAARCSQLS